VTTNVERLHRRERLVALARRQGGVLSRRQLYGLGLTRWEVAAEIKAGRWRKLGPQCVAIGDTDATAVWWQALLETGPAAVLDGASALLVAGLRTITADQIHVAVPQGAWFRRRKGIRVHETRRFREEDVLRDGIPRMAPATAAVHAALWARSDREAGLFVVAPVQQRLVAVPALAEAVSLVKRHPRRLLLQNLVRDVSEGVESLGERDFALACRRRGYPKPTRQQMRVLPSGRRYYDAVWERYGVKVELHGLQHLDAVAAGVDALKGNAASLEGSRFLQIPFLAFRVDPEPFLDQVGDALRAGGWSPPLRQRKCG
jgi:hypothetical protein